MILKIVNKEDPSFFKMFDNINEVDYSQTYGEAGSMQLKVQYHSPNRGLDTETFELLGRRAYLMNDSGKTIESFHG